MVASRTICGKQTGQLPERAFDPIEVVFAQPGEAIAQPGSSPGVALGQRRRAGAA